MSTIRTIFFDLDDTLVDNVHAQRAALADTYEEFRAVFHMIPYADVERTFEAVNWELWGLLGKGMLTEREYYTQRFMVTMNRIIGTASLMKYDVRDAFAIEPFFEARYREHTRPVAGADALLRQLRATHTLGLLTNGFVEVQQHKVARMGWSDLFTHVVTFQDAGAMKPSTQIFEAARARTGDDAHALAFVGDHPYYDMSGAKESGWFTVWYNPRRETSDDVRADVVVHALDEVGRLFAPTAR